MAVAPTPVAAAPDAPDRAQRATFSARATAFFDWIKNTFVAGVNALASVTYSNAIEAATQATAAAASASAASGSVAAAQSSAAQAALYGGAAAHNPATNYAVGAVVKSNVNYAPYKCRAAGIDASDPSANADKWKPAALEIDTGYPIIRPSLTLDFANSQIFDPRITFSRPSAATRINPKGLIETVASGVPRLTYNAVTGACEGYLVEEQRTNLCTWSDVPHIGMTTWKSALVATTLLAPDGVSMADKLVEDASINNHNASVPSPVTAGTTYTFSAFVKAAERTSASVALNTNNGAFALTEISVNLATGECAVLAGSPVSYGATPYQNGWWRVYIAGTATATAVCFPSVGARSTSSTYTGDGTSGIYIWGAQLEAGAFPTSYIPTTASQVTRAGDLAVMTGTNFSNWFRADEGTFVVDYRCDHIGGQWFPSAWYVDSGSSNRFGHSILSTNKSVNYDSLTAGVSTAFLAYANSADDVKSAFAYRQNDMAASTFGAAVVSDTSTTVPSVNAMNIGGRMSGAQLNGHIRSLRYFPRRLTNAELQTLTQD